MCTSQNHGWIRRRFMAGLFLILALAIAGGAAGVARNPNSPLRFVQTALIQMVGGEFLGEDGVVLQRTLYDCGPAALANLLQLLGIDPPPLDTLSTLTGTTAYGTSFAALRAAAGSLGVSLEARRFVPAVARVARLPLIAWYGRRHFVVVAARSPDGMLTVLDPQVGRYRAPERWFGKRWSGEALVLNGATTTIHNDSSTLSVARSGFE